MGHPRGLPHVGRMEDLWSPAVDESASCTLFRYLYLTPEDYATLPSGCVHVHEQRGANGDPHLVIDQIIGSSRDIGVENLRGSGMIAGTAPTTCLSEVWNTEHRNVSARHWTLGARNTSIERLTKFGISATSP
jgi:hypothetical protein